MTFDNFKLRVSKVVGLLGFSAEVFQDGDKYVAKVSDGTIITGWTAGLSISVKFAGGKSVTVDTNYLA